VLFFNILRFSSGDGVLSGTDASSDKAAKGYGCLVLRIWWGNGRFLYSTSSFPVETMASLGSVLTKTEALPTALPITPIFTAADMIECFLLGLDHLFLITSI